MSKNFALCLNVDNGLSALRKLSCNAARRLLVVDIEIPGRHIDVQLSPVAIELQAWGSVAGELDLY